MMRSATPRRARSVVDPRIGIAARLTPRGLAALLCGAAMLFAESGGAQLSQTVISGPVGSGPGRFGDSVVFLPNGNYVVSDPRYDLPNATDVGAVHLYRASDDERIATLTGSTPDDRVGETDFDRPAILVLPSGDYLVRAPSWNAGRGAVTWCDGVIGCSGVVSEANSSVGTTFGDRVGHFVHVLANGNYLIAADEWDDPTGPVVDAGTVRLCNGESGCFGPHSSANSLTGSGWLSRVFPLPNGNYVVGGPYWGTSSSPELGAATFCSGVAGCIGPVSAANSLVGTASWDRVGEGVSVLSDGNYVVQSPQWSKGAIGAAGAVTWCSGATGCPPGPVSAASSLTGATGGDYVGGGSGEFGAYAAPIASLPGGAYVVRSGYFNRPGVPVVVWAGAVTWCGAGGAGCTGATVDPSNSLVGSKTLDIRGTNISFTLGSGIVPLGSGAFVVSLPEWNDPTIPAASVGAAVFCDSSTHCRGQTITAANAIRGSSAGDGVGNSVVALANGHYVVGSPEWSNGAISRVGAVTFCDGTSGCRGTVSVANSYTGTTALDRVGDSTRALPNGNYVVASPGWSNGALGAAGAVTLCSGTTGCFGSPSAANSLVGTSASDALGDLSAIHPLPDSDYLVVSSRFSDGVTADVGAVTSCSGTTGCVGPLTVSNSILGGRLDDQIGNGGVAFFADDRFAFCSRSFDDGPIEDAGAITFGRSPTALTGRVDGTNSVIGSVPHDFTTSLSIPRCDRTSSIAYDPPRERFAVGAAVSNRVLLVEVPEPAVGLALVIGCGALRLLRGCPGARPARRAPSARPGPSRTPP